VLFLGVMSDLYVVWDIVDDTIARKPNGSDAWAFAELCGCFPARGASLRPRPPRVPRSAVC
jgi:hypothetical protein